MMQIPQSGINQFYSIVPTVKLRDVFLSVRRILMLDTLWCLTHALPGLPLSPETQPASSHHSQHAGGQRGPHPDQRQAHGPLQLQERPGEGTLTFSHLTHPD